MNTTITFPSAHPVLKLARSPHAAPSEEKWAATLAEERRRLFEDHEALRVREANLREYEHRLRGLQAELEAGGALMTAPARGSVAPFVRPSSKTPFETDAALQIAWEKLHRAREILEAEQTHMRDERIVLHEQQAEMKRREDAVAVREAHVAEREQLIAAAAAPVVMAELAESEHGRSAMARLTRAPFDMARSVFGGKK
jgi:hypothetical protein